MGAIMGAMVSYTLERFKEDLEAVRALGSAERGRRVGREQEDPLSESANPAPQMLEYFHEKYGPERWGDFAFRFWEVNSFISHYWDELKVEELSQDDEGGNYWVSDRLIEVLLDGFIEPQGSVKFPIHRLQEPGKPDWPESAFRAVVAETKRLLAKGATPPPPDSHS
ncbi:MAG: hypothetical protein HYV08_03305 [Deltaproteobacteria bacterium]|nr:hypothetical protein [Deltaproteobacteria bacterium]